MARNVYASLTCMTHMMCISYVCNAPSVPALKLIFRTQTVTESDIHIQRMRTLYLHSTDTKTKRSKNARRTAKNNKTK